MKKKAIRTDVAERRQDAHAIHQGLIGITDQMVLHDASPAMRQAHDLLDEAMENLSAAVVRMRTAEALVLLSEEEANEGQRR